MDSGSSSNTLRVFDSKDELSKALCAHITFIAQQRIDATGRFTLAVSGGSLPQLLAPLFAHANASANSNLNFWRVFFVDERHVALEHSDSNYFACRSLVEHLHSAHVHPIRPELPLDECAKEYEQRIRQELNDGEKDEKVPSFDLVLLGMGEDGHTASLFPGHALLNETKALIAPISDSPKPPPQRVTFTFPLLQAAKHLAFAATGAGKQDPMRWIFTEKRKGIPAGMVLEKRPDTVFFVDKAATAKL